MPSFEFESGVVTYTTKNGFEFSFNPTDISFSERLFNVFEQMDRKHEKYREELGTIADNKKIFEFANEKDKEMRSLIDGVFGLPVCDGVFGNMSVFALGGGLPVWANFVLAIMDEIDTAFAREQKATNPKIQKYLDKYKGRK